MSSNIIQGDIKKRIENWISHYPEDRKQSAVMPALRIVQEENDGYLTTPLMDEVAKFLGMPSISVYEVATFYAMYEHAPVGKHKLALCTNISCMLRGSDELLAYMKEKLNVGVREITQDGKFSIIQVECLGSCGTAPVMQVGKDYIENLTKESIDALLLELSK